MHSSGTGPATIFWGTFLAWGAQAVIWAERLRNVPRGAEVAKSDADSFYSLC